MMDERTFNRDGNTTIASTVPTEETNGMDSIADTINDLSNSSPNPDQQPSLHPTIFAPPPIDGSDVDPQIIEALKSKDRLYVLKLGEQFEQLVNEPERRSRIDLSPVTTYQRMLVHRCSALYKMKPESDPVTKVITITLTTESRIPPRRISELVPLEETVQPAFKIMRRAVRPKSRSHAGSVAGDEADLSDVEPSEAGSIGGRSNATGSSKKHMTIEQREAAYNEAKARIFMDFEAKEKDTSNSSSSVSLSGSTSAGGSSSVGDFDDMLSVSSPTTESEWSGPAARDRKDLRRSSTNTSSSSSWSWRSPGSTSSRNSRAPSPSLAYPTLYDPAAPNNPPYDPSQVPHHPTMNGGYGQIFYQFPTFPPHANAPYMGYHPYSYASPQSPQGPPQNFPDPASPPHREMYSPPPNTSYGNAYMWPGQQQLPPSAAQPPVPPPVAAGALPPPPPGSGPAFYPPYPPPPPPAYNYPMQPYMYPQQGGPPMPHLQQGQFDYAGVQHGPSPGPMPPMNRNGSGHSSTNVSRSSSSSRSSGMGKRRLWNGNHNDSVGPRMNSMRRGSSDKGSYHKSSPSNNDDGVSVASSSTTSSSSMRTYTSNASSQHHPLPARPDWAVGLKAQPTLHGSTRHDSSSSISSRSSSGPSRNGSGPTPPRPHTSSLHSTDFPPLSTTTTTEKRAQPTGAWNNGSPRSILQPNNPSSNPQMNGQTVGSPHFPTAANEEDGEFERPAPKTPPELFNPKSSSPASNGTTSKRPVSAGGKQDRPAGATIAAQLAAVTLEDHGVSPLPATSAGEQGASA